MCRYDDLSPDVGETKYPGPSYEADSRYRKPALSGGSKAQEYPPANVNENSETVPQNVLEDGKISAWDTIRQQEKRGDSGFPTLKEIKKLWAQYDGV